MKKAFVIVGAVIVIIGGYFWLTYNSLITANEAVDNQWAQIDTQYQRRLDLIPNLVESVKGVMSQETAVFGDISKARANYTNASNAEQQATAATQLEGSLSRLIAIMENYPELKSAENVQTLMTQLEGTENRISVERKRYNDVVQNFNVKIKRFPTNLAANMLNYSERVYFEAEAGAETTPKVDLINR